MNDVLFEYDKCLKILEAYDEHLRYNIAQYCDREDIIDTVEFLNDYNTGKTSMTELDLAEVLIEYRSLINCHTGRNYTEEEMEYYFKRYGKKYVEQGVYTFINNTSNNERTICNIRHS